MVLALVTIGPAQIHLRVGLRFCDWPGQGHTISPTVNSRVGFPATIRPEYGVG